MTSPLSIANCNKLPEVIIISRALGQPPKRSMWSYLNEQDVHSSKSMWEKDQGTASRKNLPSLSYYTLYYTITLYYYIILLHIYTNSLYNWYIVLLLNHQSPLFLSHEKSRHLLRLALCGDQLSSEGKFQAARWIGAPPFQWTCGKVLIKPIGDFEICICMHM